MRVVAASPPAAFLSVRQVADYLQLNEKKVYALVNEGSIPATKVTGKWMFSRELIDRWMLESSHGGLLADRLIVVGSDDPLLYRMVLGFARDLGPHALVSYTPTGARLGLELLQSRRADACVIHWGPVSESGTRHPALLRQYSQHPDWVLIRAFRREQGVMVSAAVQQQAGDPRELFDRQLRWALRQKGAGAQRFLLEVLSRYGLSSSSLEAAVTTLSEREAAAAITLGQADVAPGSRATAAEYNIGFFSFGWESFDFALPRGIWFRRLFQDLASRFQSGEALEAAATLGGYELAGSGQLVWGDD